MTLEYIKDKINKREKSVDLINKCKMIEKIGNLVYLWHS